MTGAGQRREQLFQSLHASEQGLASAEARARLRVYGSNEITFHRARSPLWMLAGEFLSLFPLLLLTASGLALVADRLSPGEGYGLIAVALLAVVVLNALVVFFQNYKVEKLMLSFLDYIPKHVVLLRDGGKAMLDARWVVPGDILFVQEGDKISADGVLLEAHQLLVDESLLTGESEPVPRVALEERVTPACQVHSGATVLKGGGTILVTGTGRSTGLGGISALSQGVRQDLTPMQRELNRFVHRISYLAVGIGAFFFAIGVFIGNPFFANLVFAIGIIVANVPEGLLPTVTLALSQASARMARRNAVIKHILAVETLGSTTVVCTDKTGTLTQNRLHVESVFLDFEEISHRDMRRLPERPSARPLIEIMALCNDVIVTGKAGSHFHGDPTEIALAERVEEMAGFDRVRERFEPLGGSPFDAERKYMTAVHRTRGGTLYMTVKGAPEVVLAHSTQVHAEGLVRPLTAADREQVEAHAAELAANGLRVLALACRVVPDLESEADELVFVGLAALTDPPRPEVPAAVRACQSAGIRLVVMSGDKGETVAYMARKLGIVSAPRVIDGDQLAGLDARQLATVLADPQVVFARIAPEQKLTIVEAFKHLGQVVAVTGDGVNDAPALKRADIGIAMGLRGTDVAKEAADIILLDDNFATIVRAIEEGRTVYDNIRKFIRYVLTSNVPEILPFIVYVLFPVPLAVTVVQILSIDLITDMLPAIGLGNEPPEKDIMRTPPRTPGTPLVGLRTFVHAYGISGMAETAVSFVVFFLILAAGGWNWGTELAPGDPLWATASGGFLAAIIFSQIGNVLACRTGRQSAVPALLRLNPWIAAGVALEVLFTLSVVYLPGLNPVFSTAPLPFWIWGLILCAPVVLFGIDELRKLLARRGVRGLLY
ncbi:MAG: cation-transporting P-type ATPase [Nitrospirota bacterium]|nr:cation-transporting P-type ATPase [Nitrospirota bacterium]